MTKDRIETIKFCLERGSQIIVNANERNIDTEKLGKMLGIPCHRIEADAYIDEVIIPILRARKEPYIPNCELDIPKACVLTCVDYLPKRELIARCLFGWLLRKYTVIVIVGMGCAYEMPHGFLGVYIDEMREHEENQEQKA